MIKRLFVSDVHLGSKLCKPKVVRNFKKLIEKFVNYDEVYLLGDIFDFWVKEPEILLKEYKDIVESLNEASASTKLYYIVGNHDFLAFDYADYFNFDLAFEKTFQVYSEKYDKWYKALVIHDFKCDPLYRRFKLLWKFYLMFGDKFWGANRILQLFWEVIAKIIDFMTYRYSYETIRTKGTKKDIEEFRKAVYLKAKKERVQFLIHGHTHKSAITTYKDVIIVDCGTFLKGEYFEMDDTKFIYKKWQKV
ncbi:hypothetical protein DRN69_05450 [Candidatus Pacearchaeota archaeon]|nr:MAG: hypothetical protein DRN69_05450 [Candidatus Pacearchaeota archaeon]